MSFCSPEFVAFFAVVFAIYWALPWPRAQVLLLLGASFAFYASWNPSLAFLIVVSSTADYLIARGLDASANARTRKLLVTASVAGNLGLLAYFKYSNFFLRTVEDGLRAAGVEAHLPVLEVILPIGISFYTFEAINYVVSVYRREIAAERDLPSFMLFILFFPHLVAGPIVRARDFLPQTHRRRRLDWARLHVGVQLLLLGLFKKLVVADRVAFCADPVFAAPEDFSRLAVWCATLAYSLQIYCDFSGYSDMALGLAHFLGYRLAINFDGPYLARNPSEFWRRWHVSLSTWLRDYLFIPLGGSRRGELRTAVALLVTMTLGGLWHGARLTFLLWGLAHGLLLVLHRLFVAGTRATWLERALASVHGTVLRVAVTFTLVSLGWILFRATTFAGMGAFFRGLVVRGGAQPAPQALAVLHLGIAVALGHALGRLGATRWLAAMPATVLGVFYGVALTVILLLAPASSKAFIYFQF